MGKRKACPWALDPWVAKHFEQTITDDAFRITRKTEATRFDGFYVLRSSLPAEQVDPAATVRAYKSIAQVERAFRCIKTVDRELRPYSTGPHHGCGLMSCCDAGLLSGMAYARTVGADAVRRSSPRGGGG